MAKRSPSTAVKQLQPYRRKRNFGRSPEPEGGRNKVRLHKAGGRRSVKVAKSLAYCVQQHQATSLHYDFRLEHHGVLLSWAVPKGPSLNPADKRLAMRVEAHPLEYGGFEGVIPEGYGAGVVMLWDRGTWEPEPEGADVDEELRRGELKFHLNGKKLHGSWVLVRTRGWGDRGGSSSSGGGGAEGKEAWLLIKHRDEWAQESNFPAGADKSIKSGLDFAGILAKHPREAGRLAQAAPKRLWAIEKRTKEEATTEKPTKKKMSRSHANGNGSLLQGKSTRPSTGPFVLQVGQRQVTISHPTKILYPQTATTKADVCDYYARIAPVLLAHLGDRPVSLKRFPDGVEGKSFFQKNCPDPRPEWVPTLKVASEVKGQVNYCVLDSPAALLWAANLACLELHAFLHNVDNPNQPTAIVLDFDPGLPATLQQCCKVALTARDELERIGLKAFAKTSGGKGLHMYIPLNTPVTYAQTKTAAQTLALHFERRAPGLVTSKMSKELRPGKVFIDWSQNDAHKTTVCAYSLRAGPTPSVSTPLSWDEVEMLAGQRGGKTKFDMSPRHVLERVERDGDLMAPVLRLKQKLPAT